MNDRVLVGLVVVTFATLATAHVAIAFGLVRRHPRWHGGVALVVFPLAPLWAWREQMRARTVVWVSALVLYVVARVAAHFG